MCDYIIKKVKRNTLWCIFKIPFIISYKFYMSFFLRFKSSETLHSVTCLSITGLPNMEN